MSMNEEKDSLRKKIHIHVREIPLSLRNSYSKEVCATIVNHTKFINSDLLLAYYPLKSEIDTVEIINKAFSLHKRVALPVIKGVNVSFYEIEKGYTQNLIESSFHTLEPSTNKKPIAIEEFKEILLLVPGVAFSIDKERLGRGKRFYDNFLHTHHKDVFSIGLCYDIQLLETLPTDPWDECVDSVVTEKRFIK